MEFLIGERYVVTLKSGESLVGNCISVYTDLYNVKPDGDMYEEFAIISAYEDGVLYDKEITYKIPFCSILSYAEV